MQRAEWQIVITRSRLYPRGGGPQTSLVDSVVSRLRPVEDGISNVVQLIELQYWLIM
jgi:hypothetical protein